MKRIGNLSSEVTINITGAREVKDTIATLINGINGVCKIAEQLRNEPAFYADHAQPGDAIADDLEEALSVVAKAIEQRST